MSVDQKQNKLLKNVEEERAQLDAGTKITDDTTEVKNKESPVTDKVSPVGEKEKEETAKKNAINTDKSSQALQPSSKPQVSGAQIITILRKRASMPAA